MRRFTLLLVGALLLLSISAQAFDGKRKGFNLGLGLGYTPTSRVSGGESGNSATDDSFILSLSAGYSFGRDVFMYEGHVFGVRHGQGVASRCCSEVTVFTEQLRWYHYFSPEGKSFFSCLGIGLSETDGGDDIYEGRGLSFTLGGGYEFLKQLQVGAYYSGAYTKGDGNTYGTRSLQFILHITAY